MADKKRMCWFFNERLIFHAERKKAGTLTHTSLSTQRSLPKISIFFPQTQNVAVAVFYQIDFKGVVKCEGMVLIEVCCTSLFYLHRVRSL